MSSTFSVNRPLGGFLTLAPTVSASYPTKEQVESATSTALSSLDLGEAAAAAAGNAVGRRRSSTVSSKSSVTQGPSQSLRFLKLDPVHYGQHVGQNNADFHEVAVEER